MSMASASRLIEGTQWITVDLVLSLFWLAMISFLFADSLVTLYLDSPYVPQFLRTVLLFGKFGKEPQLTGSPKRKSAKANNDKGSTLNKLIQICDWINTSLKKIEVPKSWFRHFYLYLLAVWCFVVLSLWISNRQIFSTFTTGHLLLATQLVQSCRRIYETHFVSIYSDNSINFLHYLTGYLFYSSLAYATYDSIQSSFSQLEWPSFVSWLYFALFLYASRLQYQSHAILARLRTANAAATNFDYHIPQQGAFQLIACPHYLAEIMIYCLMYLLVPSSSSTSFLWPSLCAFVLANQTVASIITLRWYRAKFGAQYPANIKAIIPFVL